MSPSVYCCGSLPASVGSQAKIAVTLRFGIDDSRIASSGFPTPAVGIGMPKMPAVAIGAVAIGAVAIGAVAIGAVAIGAVGIGAVAIGAVAIGAAPTAAVAIGAVAIGAELGSPVPSCVKSCGGRPASENDDAPAFVVDWSTVNEACRSVSVIVVQTEKADVSPFGAVA